MTMYWDRETGRMVPLATEGMSAPYRCTRCGHIHDAGKVEVIARYSDCSVWRCPSCNAQIDDRPIGWGGSAEPVQRGAAWPT